MQGATLAIPRTGPSDGTGPAADGGDGTRARFSRLRPSPRRYPYALAALLFCAYTVISVGRYRNLGTMSWDLGIFEQAIRNYAHLREPVADLKGPGTNILGDHFSPVTALLAPAYRLFPSPITLLVAQAALFALSSIPVTRAATRILGRRAGLAIGVAYGLSWGVQRAVNFDFHEIAFAVPLIAFSLEAVLARRWRTALILACALVFVKEDLGLTACAIALVVAVRTWRADPRTASWAFGVASLTAIAALLTFTVVIPAFNTSGGYDYWTKVSDGPGPFDGWDTKFRTLLWVLLPTTGLLALRSPLLLVALPTLGWRFVSGEEHYWGTDWHYSAVLMPVVMLALVDACEGARTSPRPWLRSYTRHLPAAVAAAALALTTSLPLAALAEAAPYEKTDRAVAVDKLLARIPDGVTVEANIGPSSRLTSRCRVFWVGNTQGRNPDYIALGNRSGQDAVEYARRLHPKASYSLTGETDGYVVLKRTRPAVEPG
ncbi:MULTISPECIES: DUF2079 domain-containing protein [unclassified Streptomyces]|uniref:DUF2079 domain-containing protein n=1 Tax=unclassified Streptomyces TaxID=2593676 RepID=UPI0037FCA195